MSKLIHLNIGGYNTYIDSKHIGAISVDVTNKKVEFLVDGVSYTYNEEHSYFYEPDYYDRKITDYVEFFDLLVKLKFGEK